jgi:hypothetical protein
MTERPTGNFGNTENTALSLVRLCKQTFVETCGAPTSSVIVRICPLKAPQTQRLQATEGTQKKQKKLAFFKLQLLEKYKIK